jgi:hypothetical protein
MCQRRLRDMRRVKFVPFVAVASAVLAAGVVAGATATPASAAGSTTILGGPMSRSGGIQPAISTSTTSREWAGYAVTQEGTSPGVMAVFGTWTQPAVTCPTPDAQVSIWVGLDGFNNGTVEQIGSAAVCTDGKPSYVLWKEMYPLDPVGLMNIDAGDSITAGVGYSPGADSYTLSINDNTKRRGSSSIEKCPSGSVCNHASVEWVAEAPGRKDMTRYPLANYGSVNFTNLSFIDTTGATATPRFSTPFHRYRIFEAYDDGTAIATPGSTPRDGGSFTITWKHE